MRAASGPAGRASEFATLLRVNAFFGSLEPPVIGRLAQLCTPHALQAGEILFQKGDPGNALYGIRRGQIRIESGTADGYRVTLNALGAGDLFGEIALLDGMARSADAVAVETTELFVLRREHLFDYLEREPAVAIKFIELLCRRLRYVSTQMEETLTLTIGARIARRLLTLAEDFGSEIEITQDQLAAYVSAARESVNRQLRVWQRAKIVDLKRGRIVLLRPNALANEGGSHAEG